MRTVIFCIHGAQRKAEGGGGGGGGEAIFPMQSQPFIKY